jgi:putative nucleotidyltransferase with HDIG domain
MDRPKKEKEHKVIVAGAQQEWLDVIASQLSANEFHLESAGSLEELSGALKKGVPDLMVLAMGFQGTDPLVLATRLSKAGVAVLMISETPTRETLIQAAKHGAIDFLVVPLQPDTVAGKIERALVKTGKKAPPEGLAHRIDFGYAKTPFDKAKVVVQKVKEVLALPFAVVKIIQLCNDPSASAKELEKPVLSDPAIAAMIMQRANSAAFASIGRTTSIQRAIMRIGMRATRNVAASFSVFKLFSKEEKSFGFDRILFWVHSLTTGICSHALASMMKYPQPEDAFLAGLLHDIGKMVLDDFLNEEFDKVLRMSYQDDLPVRLAEQSIFEANHAYFGSKIASSWGFPQVIANGIGDHHQYQKVAASAGEQSIGAIVCMGNQMAKALLAGSGGDHLAEREGSPLWTRLPKGISWGDTIRKIIEELNAYAEILDIPPENFQIVLPQERRGKAGIFLQKESTYGPLLEIAMERQGYEPVLFSSLEDPQLKEGGMSLLVADLTTVEDESRASQFQEKIFSLTDKSVILFSTDEKKRPMNLDFLWLESQVKGFQSD